MENDNNRRGVYFPRNTTWISSSASSAYGQLTPSRNIPNNVNWGK